jgi:hypothetical protein
MKLFHQVCDNRTCLISAIVVELPKSEGSITAQRKQISQWRSEWMLRFVARNFYQRLYHHVEYMPGPQDTSIHLVQLLSFVTHWVDLALAVQ